MFLKKIFVKGFKGINELNADFSLSSALIGENGWGKSSFLRLFRKVFSSSGKIAFSREDFNSACSCADPKDGTRGIQIEFQFCEQFFGEVAKSAALQKFNKYWQRGVCPSCSCACYQGQQNVRASFCGSADKSRREVEKRPHKAF